MPQTVPVGSSLTQGAYEHLRADLLNGRLQPGTRLKINELCAAIGVSLSAVREALSRLTSEGLVVAEPQRGFRVAPVSASELTDLMQVRTNIEGLCLERAIALGDVDWEAHLVAAFHRLSRAPERDPSHPERMADPRSVAHAAFHAALVGACDSPWLLKLREMLYVQSERYRRLSFTFEGVARDLNREHQEIMEAALARDAGRARSLMSQHLQLTTTSLLTRPQLALATPEPARRSRPAAMAAGGGRQPRSAARTDAGDGIVLVQPARRAPRKRKPGPAAPSAGR